MPEPWIKLKIGMRRSDKLGDLPSDSARLGYIYTLLEAKVQRRMGTFVNRRAFADVLGAYGKFFVEYAKRGLLHVAPLQCVECATRHGELTAGTVVVHDFLREQRDPTNAERQDLWRNSQPNGPGNAGPNASSNVETPPDRNAPLAPARAYAGDDRDSDSERENDGERAGKPRPPTERQKVVAWLREHDYGEPSGYMAKPFSEMCRLGAAVVVPHFEAGRAAGAVLANDLAKFAERALSVASRNGTAPRGHTRTAQEAIDAFNR